VTERNRRLTKPVLILWWWSWGPLTPWGVQFLTTVYSSDIDYCWYCHFSHCSPGQPAISSLATSVGSSSSRRLAPRPPYKFQSVTGRALNGELCETDNSRSLLPAWGNIHLLVSPPLPSFQGTPGSYNIVLSWITGDVLRWGSNCFPACFPKFPWLSSTWNRQFRESVPSTRIQEYLSWCFFSTPRSLWH